MMLMPSFTEYGLLKQTSLSEEEQLLLCEALNMLEIKTYEPPIMLLL